MTSSDIEGALRKLGVLQTENQRLRREIDDLREATLTSIRNRELQRQAELKALEESKTAEIKRLTKQFEIDLKHATRKPEASEVDAAVSEARQEWEKETQTLLDNAAEKWADAERKRIAQVKVDMNFRRREAVDERDAYWKAEFDRVASTLEPTPESPVGPVRRSSLEKVAKNESRSGGIPYPGTLVALVGVFLYLAAGYLFAPQWQPLAKTILQPALANLDTETRNQVYLLAPWLKPSAKVSSAAGAPVGYIRTRLANVRAAPSLNATVVRVVDRGAHVFLVEETESWMKVKLPSAGNERLGWLHKSVLARSTE